MLMTPQSFSTETLLNKQNVESNQIDGLIQHLPVAIYTCNRLGYITSFNSAAEKLWGRTPVIGKELWCGALKVFRPNGKPIRPDKCPMAKTLKEGIAINGEEIIVQRPDESKINVLVYPSPIFDEKGNIAGAINTLIDITEQKQAERRQAMLAAIIESSEDAIVSKNLFGIITSWNDAAQRMFGYSEIEMLGRSITTIIPPDRQQEEFMILNKIRKGERVEHYETYRLSKSGQLIPVSLTISPIKSVAGTVIGASKIVRNIDKQKSIEEKLHRNARNLEILNSVGKIVSQSLDINEILQIVTDATTKLTNADFGLFFYNMMNEQDENHILYASSGVSKEVLEKTGITGDMAFFEIMFANKGIIRSGSIDGDAQQEEELPLYEMLSTNLPLVSYLAVPIFSKSGNIVGGLLLGHSLENKFTREHEYLVSGVASQAAISLDNAALYEKVRNLSEKKDEFISLASHELKTPITSINGFLQLIDQSLTGDSSNKEFIQIALKQIRKLSGLVSDLLDVSKIEAGKLPLSFSSFDFVQFIKEIISHFQFSAKKHHIELSCDVEELMVSADRQRIEQVMINLLGNAVKYSPNANLVKVAVSKNDNNALVAITDFGIGIKKELQENIFTRFYRIEDLPHMPGLGIGLYISKEIINRHNGILWVESEPSIGSTFSFEIPAE